MTSTVPVVGDAFRDVSEAVLVVDRWYHEASAADPLPSDGVTPSWAGRSAARDRDFNDRLLGCVTPQIAMLFALRGAPYTWCTATEDPHGIATPLYRVWRDAGSPSATDVRARDEQLDKARRAVNIVLGRQSLSETGVRVAEPRLRRFMLSLTAQEIAEIWCLGRRAKVWARLEPAAA